MATKTKVSIDDGVNYDQFITFSGVQGAANGFVQVTIPTNVSPNDGFILQIKEVVLCIDVVAGISQFAAEIDLSLTRASKAAVPTMTDLDIIAKQRILTLGAGAVAAGAAGLIENPINLTYSGKQIIASPNVYLQFDSNNFLAAMQFSGRIYYDQVSMSKDRILEILYG